MINWKVRIRNKAFWLALIPAVLLLAQSLAAAVGYELQLGDLGDKTAYEQVMLAVSDFEKGNLRLSTILAAMQE